MHDLKMPPTLQTMSPVMQQSSPAAADSPNVTAAASTAAGEPAPTGTVFYQQPFHRVVAPYNVLYDDSGLAWHPEFMPMPYAMVQDTHSQGSTGSSPSPGSHDNAPQQHSPAPDHRQQQPMAGLPLPVAVTTTASGYQATPAQPQEALYQPAVEGGMVYGIPGVPAVSAAGPGGVTPTQMLHIQIPIQAQQSSSVSQCYQPSDSTLSVPVPASSHSSVTTNMEVVWHSEFDRLFRGLNPNHKWFLVPCLEPPKDRDYHSFKDSAKVRFCCKCGNGWTSMKGRVMFWFYLDQAASTGFVYFRLYGQRCSKCNDPEFTHAMWYPEEVLKVVSNVYKRVGQVFYNFYQPPLALTRRDGKPRNQHNAKLCQACAEGVCKEGFIAS